MNNTDFHQFKRMYHYLDNLDSKRFNLKDRFVIGNVSDLGKRKIFGTSKACFLGYLPVVFTTWSWFYDGIPLLKENSTGSAFKDAAHFFGISEYEINQLSIAKYYTKPNLETVLRRMYSISKSYGFKIN